MVFALRSRNDLYREASQGFPFPLSLPLSSPLLFSRSQSLPSLPIPLMPWVFEDALSGLHGFLFLSISKTMFQRSRTSNALKEDNKEQHPALKRSKNQNQMFATQVKKRVSLQVSFMSSANLQCGYFNQGHPSKFFAN